MTVDLASAMADMRDALASQMPELGDAYDQMLAGSPTFMMGALEFEADAVRMDAVSTAPTGDMAVSNGARDLADQVPADALFYADGRDVGKRLGSLVTSMQAALASSGMDPATLNQVEDVLGASLEDYVSWIGDGQSPPASTAASPTWAWCSRPPTRMPRARGWVNSRTGELAALDSSTGVTVQTDTVAGAEVTTVRSTFRRQLRGVPTALDPVVLQWAVDGDGC